MILNKYFAIEWTHLPTTTATTTTTIVLFYHYLIANWYNSALDNNLKPRYQIDSYYFLHDMVLPCQSFDCNFQY